MSNIAKNSLPSTALLVLISIANPVTAIALPTNDSSQAEPSPAAHYGCISGEPNGTYQGDRAVTRYEFAAGLNACLNQIDRQLETPSSDRATREDFQQLTNQMERDLQELRNLNQRLGNLESELK